MTVSRWYPAVLGLVLFAMACGSSEPAAPASTQAAPGGAASQSSGEFGVPACDDYVKKYLACIDAHVPETARAMVRQSLDQSREQWERAAATPEGKQGLTSACQQAEAASRTAMQAYGCEW